MWFSTCEYYQLYITSMTLSVESYLFSTVCQSLVIQQPDVYYVYVLCITRSGNVLLMTKHAFMKD